MSNTTLVHDTIRVSRSTSASLRRAWDAYIDTTTRAQWGVPPGEEMIFDHDDVRPGGMSQYRCGAPAELAFHVDAQYIVVEPTHLIIHTESVRTGDHLLATGLLSWEFARSTDGTTITVTNQVTSLVGQDMIDGTRDGHMIALSQFAAMLDDQ